jgi:hypothetical protein
VRLGNALSEGGRLAEAGARFERARAIGLRAQDPDDVIDALVGLGKVAQRRRAFAAALRLFDDALARREASPGAGANREDILLARANLLWDAGPLTDRARARALATEARAGFVAQGLMRDARRVTDWLAQHATGR